MKIVVIEDHALIRGLIERVSEDAFGSPRLAAAKDGRQGVELCGREQPELVLLDLELPDGDGVDFIPEIRAAAPRARILVLSAHTESFALHRVREAGVEGFVDKNEQTPESLAAALRAVASGGRYVSPSVQDALARLQTDPHAFSKVLSNREQDLLRLLGQGHSDQTVAEKTGLAEVTVRNHRRNIMSKLGIHSTPELIRYALENGFSRVPAKAR